MAGEAYDQISEVVMKSYHLMAWVGLASLSLVSSVLATGEERYSGGSFDGYSEGLLLQSEVIELGSRFAGGGHDGYSEGLSLQSDPLELGARFAGGSYDGQDDACITNQASPLLSDSDGDELVDWWELIHVDSLAILYGHGDYDEDGATDLHELIADTFPANSDSVFRITKLGGAHAVSVSFACTNTRIYSLQSAVSLVTGDWSFAAGQTNVPGEVEGTMSLVDTNAATLKTYRVLVTKP